VDTITGRPDDLGHIGPHGVKALTHKRTSVTGPGDRNLTGMGLIPGTMNDIGLKIIVPQCPVFGIYHPGEDTLCTLLHTAETALAGVNIFRLFHGAYITIIIFEYFIDTLLFDTFFTTARAVFPEFNGGIFTYRIKAG
jgi:hypothetical protein